MQKFANLVELEKCYQNAYFLAKIRFDTAENEPAKKLQRIAKIISLNFPKFANFAKPSAKHRTPKS